MPYKLPLSWVSGTGYESCLCEFVHSFSLCKEQKIILKCLQVLFYGLIYSLRSIKEVEKGGNGNGFFYNEDVGVNLEYFWVV